MKILATIICCTAVFAIAYTVALRVPPVSMMEAKEFNDSYLHYDCRYEINAALKAAKEVR